MASSRCISIRLQVTTVSARQLCLTSRTAVVGTIYVRHLPLGMSTVKNNICDNIEGPASRLEAEPDKEKLISTLESFHVLHSQNKYRLSDERFRIVTLELVKLWRTKNLEQAYQRAKFLPNDELCKSVIKQYEDSLP